MAAYVVVSPGWLAGNIGRRLLEFAFGIILARLLVPADFGMIVTISAFTGIVSIVSSGGMGQSLIRARDADDNDFSAAFTMQLTLGVVIYVCFYIAAPLIAVFFNNPLYTDLLARLGSCLFDAPFRAHSNRLAEPRHGIQETIASGRNLQILSGASSCLMAWLGMGVWSLILSGLLGSLVNNLLLTRITPVALRINFDWTKIRAHGGYGSKITVNDLLTYITRESKNLLISKLAGPTFMGLYNKAESLSRLPNQLVMPPTMQPVFRAMSMIQHDLGQTKAMYNRAIALLMVYTTPMYVGLWWVATPFIGLVYGEKWLAVAEPMQVLLMSGLFTNIAAPSGALLDAQNRLTQEMVALIVRLAVTIAAVFVGLTWGLQGLAWAIFSTHVFSAAYYFVLVRNTIGTTLGELLQSATPGLILNSLLFAVLGVASHALGSLQTSLPAIYLFVMLFAGLASYVAAFVLLPIPALKSESERWKHEIAVRLPFLFQQRR